VDYTPPFPFPAIPPFGSGVLPLGAPTLEQQQALGAGLQRLAILLTTNYSWLNVPGYPDPIPSDLLKPFGEWVNDNDFTGLAPFFNQFTSGLGSYEDLTTLYALGILSPTVLLIFGVPNAAFHINGGCVQIYHGMVDYLGADNVFFDFTTTSVERPCGANNCGSCNGGGGKTTLRGISSVTGEETKFHCGEVIVSFAPTIANLEAFDLDTCETTVFDGVKVRHYWGGVATVTGDVTTGAFNINNADFTSPFLQATYPGLILLNKQYDYERPATFNLASPTYFSNAAITSLANSQAAYFISKGLIDSFHIDDMDYHQYQPFVSGDDLSVSPNFYTRFRQKQGYRDTWYVGATTAYAGTYIVWEAAYNLITANFPAKH